MHRMPEEERFQKAVAGDAAIIASMARAVRDRFGEAGLEALRQQLTETYRKLIPSVARQAGARVGDGGIEDWLKVESYICQLSGMDFQTEAGPNRGVLRVTRCPMEGQYRRIDPDCCRDVFIGLERGIIAAINPRMQVKGLRYLPRGEGACELVCELKTAE